MPALVEYAPAKVNLTLRVGSRRDDGYHDIESLVVFAQARDRVSLVPGEPLSLSLRGPAAEAMDGAEGNLVLKAAHALRAEIKGLDLGRFELIKELPVAAGLGGGSADAAAALRLLARANELQLDDRRLLTAARATGADVPVCLLSRPCVMRGLGDILSEPLQLPSLQAVLVHPGLPVSTKDVFATFDTLVEARSLPPPTDIPQSPEGLLAYLQTRGNDLEVAAISLQPVIERVLLTLRELPGCSVARMSGSGGACFGLFDRGSAAGAARAVKAKQPHWWVCATALGSG
ncbi:MAG: 4-(cytidine 5'-diphospho)-2-C-methyl-D-erythritol kinase [Pseudomonadota bacterium]|nr:4-(cytidine 5'-diphospho)-2-C-methyl-D-erythritol kinase [Pseudomonadota bacterium]